MYITQYKDYVIPVVFVTGLVLSLFIVKPFVVPLLSSAIIAYLFYPVFRWLRTWLKNDSVSAIVVTIIVLFLLVGPLIMITSALSREAYVIYIQGKEMLNANSFTDCAFSICFYARELLNSGQVRIVLQRAMEGIATYLIGGTSHFLLTLPQRFVELLVMIIATFYFLRDGDKITISIKRLLIAKKDKKAHILKRFDDVMYAVVFGSFLVALIQGFLGFLGFLAVGIQSPLTWGVLMFFLALIPYTGTGLVWVPASAILIFQGVTSDTSSLIFKGIGLFVYGLLLIGSIDNFLKPRIIGERSRVHPILVLVGILGGVALMGVPGLFVGPVVVAMTITFLELYVVPKEKMN